MTHLTDLPHSAGHDPAQTTTAWLDRHFGMVSDLITLTTPPV